ncbi:hypothetical protein SSX86_013772 [Deinandra increscens subsp. villosa]|uniref:Fe2OG dioxygenase domain-containing protein n=1 Tax=Deinandra increscens subsp. villosa TaxID=3103831 RepID=A0AAP0H1G6_9ASTR
MPFSFAKVQCLGKVIVVTSVHVNGYEELLRRFGANLGESGIHDLRQSMQEAFHGGISKQQCYLHLVPSRDNYVEDTEPFSLITAYDTTDSWSRWVNLGRPPQKLAPGMILFKDYLNLVGQVEIVDLCQKQDARFYQPSNPSGAKLRLHTMCFGRNWDPVIGYTSSGDGSEPPPVPRQLTSLARDIIKIAQRLVDIPSMCPDICLVNFFRTDGRLGLHQDRDESSSSLERGLPVISISIGDTAEFLYGHTRDENKLDRVLLESGDVLVYGGDSRLIFHGDAFLGQCYLHLVPSRDNYVEDTEPFSLITTHDTTGSPSRWTNYLGRPPQKLAPGMLLFKDYLNLVGQVEIVDLCQKQDARFYQPSNPSGAKLRLRMMSFGRNWDPVTGYTSSGNGSEPPPVPRQLTSLARAIIRKAQRLVDIPSMCPDICLVNFFRPDGRLGLHQDRDESSSSLERGLPVISISIGDTAEFLYGHTRDESKLDRVLLESGDVLVYGGDSRLIFHGVRRILLYSGPRLVPQISGLQAGCLNLTLRQF